MAVRKRRHEQVDGREPMMANPGKLALRVHGSALHLCVDGKMGEGLELIHDRVMVGGASRGVTGFE
jgi:hypothetical protein